MITSPQKYHSDFLIFWSCFTFFQKHCTGPHQGVSDEAFGCCCSWGDSRSRSRSQPLDSTAQAVGNTTTWWLSWSLNCELGEFWSFQSGILKEGKRKFYMLTFIGWYKIYNILSDIIMEASNQIAIIMYTSYDKLCWVLFTEEVLLLFHGELCEDTPKVVDDFIVGFAVYICSIL